MLIMTWGSSDDAVELGATHSNTTGAYFAATSHSAPCWYLEYRTVRADVDVPARFISLELQRIILRGFQDVIGPFSQEAIESEKQATWQTQPATDAHHLHHRLSRPPSFNRSF